MYEFTMHVIQNEVLKTKKSLRVAESKVEHFNYDLVNVIKKTRANGNVAVWICLFASSLFTLRILILATEGFAAPGVLLGWMQILGISIGYFTLCFFLAVCSLLQLKSKSDPAQLHSRPHGGTVVIGEECGHNWSRNFLSYVTVSLHCHDCISL